MASFCALAAFGFVPALHTPPRSHACAQPARSTVTACEAATPTDAFDRRAALGLLGASAAALLGMPAPASAMVGSTNPANNYYFPMAKYRYLPRIYRSWVTADTIGPDALRAGNWEGMTEVVERLDDSVTAMPLYTGAVEGSRSGKKKKKSDTQKTMLADTKKYAEAVEALTKAVKRKDAAKAEAALTDARKYLLDYRKLAKIDGDDGGMVSIPVGNAEEVRSRAATPAALAHPAPPEPRSRATAACPSATWCPPSAAAASPTTTRSLRACHTSRRGRCSSRTAR